MIEVMYIHCALSPYIDYCERPILMYRTIQVVTALCCCPIFECGKVLNTAYKHTGFHTWFGLYRASVHFPFIIPFLSVI